jgi:hypothetical protein
VLDVGSLEVIRLIAMGVKTCISILGRTLLLSQDYQPFYVCEPCDQKDCDGLHHEL